MTPFGDLRGAARMSRMVRSVKDFIGEEATEHALMFAAISGLDIVNIVFPEGGMYVDVCPTTGKPSLDMPVWARKLGWEEVPDDG